MSTLSNPRITESMPRITESLWQKSRLPQQPIGADTSDMLLEEVRSISTASAIHRPSVWTQVLRNPVRLFHFQNRHIKAMRAEQKRFRLALLEATKDYSKWPAYNADIKSVADVAIDRSLSNACELPTFKNESLMTLKALSRPRAEQWKQFERVYTESCLQLGTGMSDMLEAFVNYGIIGRVNYSPGNRHCEFSDFRTKAVLTGELVGESTRSFLSEEDGCPYLRDGQWLKDRTTKEEVNQRRRIVVRHVWRKTLMSDIAVVPLGYWLADFPERIARIIEATPAYLKPMLHVIAGGVERELIVEVDVAVSSYSYSTVQARTETVRHDDPALVLMPSKSLTPAYVLAAWCPDECPEGYLSRKISACWHWLNRRNSTSPISGWLDACGSWSHDLQFSVPSGFFRRD